MSGFSPDPAYTAALKAGDDAHLLTVGSPTRGLALRITVGTLVRSRWVGWLPDVFLIWSGRRIVR